MPTRELTEQNFQEHVDRQGIVFVDFWAAWCGPCRAFAPIFEAAAERHPDVTWGKIDTDAQQRLAAEFAIRSIPTLMVFRDGILVFEQAGLLPAAAIDRLLGEIKGLDMDDIRRRLAEAEAEAGAESEAE